MAKRVKNLQIYFLSITNATPFHSFNFKTRPHNLQSWASLSTQERYASFFSHKSDTFYAYCRPKSSMEVQRKKTLAVDLSRCIKTCAKEFRADDSNQYIFNWVNWLDKRHQRAEGGIWDKCHFKSNKYKLVLPNSDSALDNVRTLSVQAYVGISKNRTAIEIRCKECKKFWIRL